MYYEKREIIESTGARVVWTCNECLINIYLYMKNVKLYIFIFYVYIWKRVNGKR